jgi:hypothetical protein
LPQGSIVFDGTRREQADRDNDEIPLEGFNLGKLRYIAPPGVDEFEQQVRVALTIDPEIAPGVAEGSERIINITGVPSRFFEGYGANIAGQNLLTNSVAEAEPARMADETPLVPEEGPATEAPAAEAPAPEGTTEVVSSDTDSTSTPEGIDNGTTAPPSSDTVDPNISTPPPVAVDPPTTTGPTSPLIAEGPTTPTTPGGPPSTPTEGPVGTPPAAPTDVASSPTVTTAEGPVAAAPAAEGAGGEEGGDAQGAGARMIAGQQLAAANRFNPWPACPDIGDISLAFGNTPSDAAFNRAAESKPYTVDVYCSGYQFVGPGGGAGEEYGGLTAVTRDLWTDLRFSANPDLVGSELDQAFSVRPEVREELDRAFRGAGEPPPR